MSDQLPHPAGKPAWLISQLRERGICEVCASQPAAPRRVITGRKRRSARP